MPCSVCGLASPPLHSLRLAEAENLRRLLARCPRSALGPDCIEYAHWARAHDMAVRALHAACIGALSGEVLPPRFNHGMLAFIQKSAVRPGQDESATRMDLRPLTLGNTFHKLIMMLANMMLEVFAQVVAHASQPGFIRGRDLLTNGGARGCRSRVSA